MESTEGTPPAPSPVAEQTLKAVRFSERYVTKKTEAVVLIHTDGSYSLLDMQKGFVLTPSNPLNEQWREALKKPAPATPAKVQKDKVNG